MSRVGKKPINIKDAKVTLSGNTVTVKGKLGELKREVHPNISVEIQGEELLVKRPDDMPQNRALHGLTRALIQNMVSGVTEGFSKTLDIPKLEPALLGFTKHGRPIFSMILSVEITSPLSIYTDVAVLIP